MISRKTVSEARSDVSHVGSNGHQECLSPEERVVYAKWRRGVLLLYGAAAIFLGGLMLVQVHSGDRSPELRAAPEVTLAKRGG